MKKIIAYLIVLLLFGCVEKHKPDVYTKRYSIGGGAIIFDSAGNVPDILQRNNQPIKGLVITTKGKMHFRESNKSKIKLKPSAFFTISRVDPRPFYEFYNGKVFLNDSTGRHELCKCVKQPDFECFECEDQSADSLILDSLISLPDPGLILPKIDSAKPLPYYSLDTCKGGIGFSIPPCLVGDHAPNCSHRRYVEMEQRKAVFERQWYMDHPDTSARMQDNFPLHF